MSSTTVIVPDLSDIAKDARRFFTQKAHKPDETFYCMGELTASEDWIKDMVHAAHGDMLPDDYKYEFIVGALDILSSEGDPERAVESIEPDVYTANLTKWLASNNSRLEYLDQVLEDNGGVSAFDALAYAQLNEAVEVFDVVVDCLTKRQQYVADLPF